MSVGVILLLHAQCTYFAYIARGGKPQFFCRFYWRTGRPTDCRRPGEEIRFILRYGFYQIPGSEIRFLNELRFLSKAR